MILAVVAVVAFGGAYLAFQGGGSSSDESGPPSPAGSGSGRCPANATANASYQVRLEEQPRVESTTMLLAVTHNGKAVTDATVCLSADMSGMSHEGVGGQARKLAGGRYQVDTKFPMRGPWAGSVTVAEAGKAVASVPITFDVQ